MFELCYYDGDELCHVNGPHSFVLRTDVPIRETSLIIIDVDEDSLVDWKNAGTDVPLYLLIFGDIIHFISDIHELDFWKVDLIGIGNGKAQLILKEKLGKKYLLEYYIETGNMFHNYYVDLYSTMDNPMKTYEVIKDCIDYEVDF